MPDSTNYFAFYGLPEAFVLDEAALKSKYYQLSRELHPDFHAQDTPAAQAEALRLSTLNTDAYRTLADPDRRMAYLLGQHGMLEEGSAQNQLPSDFLMEVMDLNEQLMELEMDPDPTATQQLDAEVTALADTLDAGIQPVLVGYGQLPPDHLPAALAQVRTYYLKKRYLLRLRQQLATFAARS
jgi:molecular chaperone HscB